MNKLKIGDPVCITDKHDTYAGETGVIKHISGDTATLELDKPHDGCHSGGGYCESNRGWNVNLKNLEYAGLKRTSKIKIDSVILDKDKKEEIRAAISQTKYIEQIFVTWGFNEIFEKGFAITLLFWGIPGTGKTLMAQAVADELNMELQAYGPAEIETSEPGGAERNIQGIFRDSKASKKIILFDECDSLLMDRNEVGPIIAGQINTLLSELEKFDGVIIFTTNRLGKLDPALERRIGAKIEFSFPDEKARLAIWKRMIPKKAPLAKDVELEKLAKYPIAGGNIKNAVLNAARMAAYKKQDEIKLKNFIEAIEAEAKSIQSFAAEFESQTHQSIGKHLVRTGSSVVINKEMVRTQTREHAKEMLRSIKKMTRKHRRKV